jgi:NADPH2:quinone reductase
MTAALSLYYIQQLPTPWLRRTSTASKIPLIVYGASSSLGSFAIKLAKSSNIHPIIAICGGSQGYVKTIIDLKKGDTIVDYRNGIDSMKVAIRKAIGDLEVYHALDAISSKGTWIPISQMLSPGGQITVVSGANAYDEADIPKDVVIKYTYVGAVHSGAYLPQMPKQPMDKESVNSAPEFAYVFFRYLSRMLFKGTFEGHPYVVIPGGLDGVRKGLQQLKEGKSKGSKFVYRILETDRRAQEVIMNT